MANMNAPDQTPLEKKFTPPGAKNASRARMNALKARIRKPKKPMPTGAADTTKLV